MCITLLDIQNSDVALKKTLIGKFVLHPICTNVLAWHGQTSKLRDMGLFLFSMFIFLEKNLWVVKTVHNINPVAFQIITKCLNVYKDTTNISYTWTSHHNNPHYICM